MYMYVYMYVYVYMCMIYIVLHMPYTIRMCICISNIGQLRDPPGQGPKATGLDPRARGNNLSNTTRHSCHILPFQPIL